MKITIIIPDGTVSINGEGYSIDVSPAPARLHAVQWYETWGEEEWGDGQGRIIRNQEISSYSDYQWAIDAWNAAKAAAQAEEEARRQAAQSNGPGPTVV